MTAIIADALRAAIDMISLDRQSFADCNARPDGSIDPGDATILREYDDVLDKLRAALRAAERNAEMLEAARELLALKEELEPPQPPSAQAEPVAWRITDGEGGYDYRDDPPEDWQVAWVARWGRKHEPLYTQPPSAQAEVVEELAALARFGAACLVSSMEELCDLDADWLQAVAEATGCLVRKEPTEPCADYCRCADESDSLPMQCLRAPDRLWRLAVALDSGRRRS